MGYQILDFTLLYWSALHQSTWWNCGCPVSSAAGRQSLRSASRGDLIIPRFRLGTFGFRGFAISGPQLWNSLPLDVRQSRDNSMQFKMKLKTFLFQQFWALLWIQSNEGPYKCSILLLLLLLLEGRSWTEIWSMWRLEQACFEFSVC